MRMTMRLAYATVNPVTVMQPGSAITARWPFAAIVPLGATVPGPSAIDVKTGYPATGPQMMEVEDGQPEELRLTRSEWEQGVLREQERQQAERDEVAQEPDAIESGEGRQAKSGEAKGEREREHSRTQQRGGKQ